MAASTPLINSPHIDLGRHTDLPFMSRPKRSDSIPYDGGAASRAHYDHHPPGRFRPGIAPDSGDDSTFIPTSLGEHLLEQTYLDDVVRPLVRALVKARMTYTNNSEGAAESSQVYADLDKLRRELERSAQRARHAEQERDDLARRLDLAGVPNAPLRDRTDRFPDHAAPAEPGHAPRIPPQPAPSMIGIKRPRPSEAEPPLRNAYEPRSSAPGSTGVSVSVPHGEGSASITVTTEGPSGPPISLVSRPHHAPLAEQMSPPSSYAHPGAARLRAYPDAHHDAHDAEPRHLTRMPLTNAAVEAEYAYADERERADRYAMAPASSAHRPGMPARYAGMGARSPPPPSSSYLTSSSERSSMPALTTYPSTSSASSYSATQYSSSHPYDHEMDEMERSRKLARLRGDPHDHASLPPGRAMGTPGGYFTPSDAGSYPVRKLASTKNRTCSNCAAPHDAKFRRGPNGPGTLCDRCGSRWKKFKEQESANKREHDAVHHASSAAAAASAGAAAHARLSSASSSSQSPMEPSSGPSGAVDGGARASDGDLAQSADSVNGRTRRDASAAAISPSDANAASPARERERSASVDQLVDE